MPSSDSSDFLCLIYAELKDALRRREIEGIGHTSATLFDWCRLEVTLAIWSYFLENRADSQSPARPRYFAGNADYAKLQI